MSAGRDLWIIDPSSRYPERQGVERILDGWRGSSRVFMPTLQPGDGPDANSGYATCGVVLMGSAASVHDPLPWLEPLRAWLQPIVDGTVDVPLLGICFGHQLIAHCAGGEVGWVREDGMKRLGVETSRIEGSRLLPGVDALRVVVSHREQVRSCPAGFRITARREGVAVDGLEHESRPVYSYQFHPEAGSEFAGRAGIRSELLDDRLNEDSRRLLGAFRSLAAARSAVTAD